MIVIPPCMQSSGTLLDDRCEPFNCSRPAGFLRIISSKGILCIKAKPTTTKL